ncbi:MAG: TetR/AcrR family transcriptional regulator [Patescibacteria group bacterium]|nr:TetR/AcrR family transcriptional regulator [Patescibacteria group bacterium]
MSHDAGSSDTSDKGDAILEMAIRTFAELGYRATDVQVIADRAGVGKGTVYRHFGAKEELFWTAAFEVFKRLRHALIQAEQAASGAVAKLRAAALAYGRFFDQHPECLELFVQDRAEFRGTGPEAYKHEHEALMSRFLGIVEQGMANGELRTLDPRKCTIALSGLLDGLTMQACYLSHGMSMQEIIEHGVDVFLGGMQPLNMTGGEGNLAARCVPTPYAATQVETSSPS